MGDGSPFEGNGETMLPPIIIFTKQLLCASLSCVLPETTLRERHPPFTEEKDEAQRGSVLARSHTADKQRCTE